MNGWLQVRRVIDPFVAFLLVLIAGPVSMVVALMILIADRRPVLIWLSRVGQHGRPFPMWKFRTMRAAGVNGSADGLRLTATHDPRVTAMGRLLRGVHLDELPQLVNVLRGTMALVGPRPEVDEYVDRSDPGWHEVLAIRPGIAGLTQVVIGELEVRALAEADPTAAYRDLLPLKVQLDAFYARHASPALDLAIVVDLVGQTLLRRSPRRCLRHVARRQPQLSAALENGHLPRVS